MALTPTQTQQFLTTLRHQPRHNLGQNFLIDPNIVQKQLQLAQIVAEDTVVEIGPGLGTLTQSLLALNATVYAIELDKTLYQHLNQNLLPSYAKSFHLMQGDAIDDPLAHLPQIQKTFKIVANLPYAISTPWFAKILEKSQFPQKIVVMLQKEAAERLSAIPKTKKIGPISLFLQAIYEVEGTHKVSKNAFYPIPDVDSVLLVLNLRQNPYHFHAETKKIIHNFFTKRRKQLAHLIKQYPEFLLPLTSWANKLITFNIPLETRPEMLDIKDWILLDTLIRNTHA